MSSSQLINLVIIQPGLLYTEINSKNITFNKTL